MEPEIKVKKKGKNKMYQNNKRLEKNNRKKRKRK